MLGVLLAGIVAMQVEVLKLNASTGVSLQRTTALQDERDLLQADVARLADDQRIERIAAQMGMEMPAPSQVKFLATGGANTRAAVANIHQPDSTAFLTQLPGAQTTGGVDTGAAPVSASATDPTASTTGSSASTTGSTASTTATGTAGVATGGTGTTGAPGTTGTTGAPATTGTTGTTGPASTGSTGYTAAAPTVPAATGTGTTSQSPATSTGTGASTGGVGATPSGG